jgi:F0F1-type ATP synthase assembly protein I
VVDLAIQGIASLLIGAGVGYWLKTSYDAPIWVQLLCILFGIAAAVLTLVRAQRRLEKLEGESDEPSGPPA